MFAVSLWIVLPLFALLAASIVIELRTGLILDVLTLPSIAYFLVATAIVGAHPFWQHLLAGIAIAAAFIVGGITVPHARGRGERIGMGAVKLLTATAIALGLVEAGAMSIGFVLLALVAAAVTSRQRAIPSSPLTAVTTIGVLLLGWGR